MIDTIILSIPKDEVTALDKTSDGVLGWDLHARAQAYAKYVRNPSSKDKASGLYFPRLTGYRRRNSPTSWTASIKIEFSAPKLIHGNNVEELANSDFDRIVSALANRLYRMGLVVTQDALKKC